MKKIYIKPIVGVISNELEVSIAAGSEKNDADAKKGNNVINWDDDDSDDNE